jgi:oligosaccharyltransferase complex subunit alpha (ribophorin I)
LLALDRTAEKQLAFLQVTSTDGKGKKKGQVMLQAKPLELEATENIIYYQVDLDKPLKKDVAVTIEVYAAYTQLLKPFPEEISQTDTQLVLYHDTAQIVSPYPVKYQVTQFKLPTYRVESYTKVEESKVSDGAVTYGPYENVEAYAINPVTLHFENNSPFAVVATLEREIEISHWGSIFVTEKYNVKHAGARHKGVFSRSGILFSLPFTLCGRMLVSLRHVWIFSARWLSAWFLDVRNLQTILPFQALSYCG